MLMYAKRLNNTKIFSAQYSRKRLIGVWTDVSMEIVKQIHIKQMILFFFFNHT